MYHNVNLTPSPEEIKAVYEKYRIQEAAYPKPKIHLRIARFFHAIIYLIIVLPLFIICIATILFLMVLKIIIIILRIFIPSSLLKKSDHKKYTKNKVLEKRKKRTPETFDSLDKITFTKDECREKASVIENKWQNEESNMEDLMNYGVYQPFYDKTNGKLKALYVFDQLKQLPKQSEIKYEFLYWNLATTFAKLRFYNLCEYYFDLAIEHGFKPPKQRKKGLAAMIVRMISSVEEIAKNVFRNP